MARPTLAEVAARPVQPPSFLKNRNDLDKLLRLLNKETEVAVRKLVKIIETSQDEKLVHQCVRTFLEFNLAASEAKEKSEITRMLAELKYLPNGMGGSTDDTPELDFDTVSTCE